jgi:ATP-dependent RNA helicase RhlE
MLFSATMPAPIMELARDLQRNPATINLERKSMPAVGITQAIYPVQESLKSALFMELIRRGDLADVIVFTRTKHRANRLAEVLERNGVSVARIHGNRSQAQRTMALDGFKRGEFQVLVATDIVARGIDVEQLSPRRELRRAARAGGLHPPRGRTARADAKGDAFTFVAPDEEADLRAIERAVGRSLPRIVFPVSITRSGRQSASRCRSASASRPSARVRRKTGSVRKRRRNGAPQDRVATARRQRQRGHMRNRLRGPRRRASPRATRRTAARAPAIVFAARGLRVDRRNRRGARAVGTHPVAASGASPNAAARSRSGPPRSAAGRAGEGSHAGARPAGGPSGGGSQGSAADHVVDDGEAAGVAAAEARGPAAPNASPGPRATGP